MKENYQIYLPYQFRFRPQSVDRDTQLPHKKMKTMFLWNMSKSRRLTSTFFPTMTHLGTHDTSNGDYRREEKSCKHWPLFKSIFSPQSQQHWIAPSLIISYAYMHVFFFNCIMDHAYILYLSPLKVRKRDWAKWAKILKSTLTDEQLSSNRCFCIFACIHIHQYTSLLILVKIRKKLKKIPSKSFVKKDWKNHNAKNICRREFCLAPNERELSNLLSLSIST